MSYGTNDDRPRRRRSRRRRGPGVGVWVTLVGLAVLVAIGGIVAVVVSRKGGGDVAPGDIARGFGKASPPIGWKEYTFADAGFKAYFPNEPRRVSDESLGILGEVAGRGLMIEYTAHGVEDDSALTAWVYTRRIPPHIPADKYRDMLNKEVENTARFPIRSLRLIETRSVTWMGHSVKEFRLTPEKVTRGKQLVSVERSVATDAYEINAEVSMEDGRKLTSRLVDGFFDNIQPLK
jgi:hypothetical protein